MLNPAPCRAFTSVLAILLLAACTPKQSGSNATTDSAAQPTPTPPTDPANAYYSEIYDDPVKLTDGSYEGEQFEANSPIRPTVTLLSDYYVKGDLDADGAEETIAFLEENSGGTGHFLYLAVLKEQSGEFINTATALIGDRVQIRGARIENNRVAVDVVQAGPDDPACCPAQLATRSWTAAQDGLVEADPIVMGTLSLDAIAGKEWVLRRFTFDERTPETPEATLNFVDGNFAGSAGCNRYNAAVRPGAVPHEINVTPIVATRMMCPDDAMAVEARFLIALQGVTQFGFHAGQLALTYQSNGTFGTMLFDPR